METDPRAMFMLSGTIFSNVSVSFPISQLINLYILRQESSVSQSNYSYTHVGEGY